MGGFYPLCSHLQDHTSMTIVLTFKNKIIFYPTIGNSNIHNLSESIPLSYLSKSNIYAISLIGLDPLKDLLRPLTLKGLLDNYGHHITNP